MRKIVKNVNTVDYSDFETVNKFNTEHAAEFCNDIEKRIVEIRVGYKQARFTIYKSFLRYYTISYRPEVVTKFVKIAGSTFEKAIEDALKYATEHGYHKIEIIDDTTYVYSNDYTIFQFGKYKGQKIEDVAKTNFSYLMFFRNITPKDKLTEKSIELVKSLIDKHFKEIENENRENHPTEYVGKIGDKLTNIQLFVYKYETHETYNGFIYKYICQDIITDNFIVIKSYEHDKYQFKLNQIISVKSAKVKYQYEKLGIKYTDVNYVKLNK